MIHPYFGKVPNHLSETYPFHPGLLQDDIEGWKMQEWNIDRVQTILDYQFGKGIGKILTNGETDLQTRPLSKAYMKNLYFLT